MLCKENKYQGLRYQLNDKSSLKRWPLGGNLKDNKKPLNSVNVGGSVWMMAAAWVRRNSIWKHPRVFCVHRMEQNSDMARLEQGGTEWQQKVRK